MADATVVADNVTLIGENIQSKVGATLLGTKAVAEDTVKGSKPIESVLEQVRNLQEATVDKVTEVWEILKAQLDFEKDEARKLREQGRGPKGRGAAGASDADLPPLVEKQANSVLDMPLKKLTTLEKKQINEDIKKLRENKNYFENLLNERSLLLKLLIEELLVLKKKFNVKRKTKLLKNIDQNEELLTINNQILEEFITKKTKLYIDNRLYLKRMILNNYKKCFEEVNKIIDNKNIQKFICNIEKNIKLIGITNTGKVFNIDWESSINKDYKLDNKILGNIHPSEIINFHSIKKETRNYLCILNSDGRFKKVLFDEDMIKSNRSFTITKLKNNLKTIDSFISNESKNLIILTSIGRIFKFNLSNKFLTPTSKQSQGLIIAKLLPSEKIVSCCTFNDGENIFLITKQGKIFCINSNEIYCSNEYSLGYLNEKTQLKNDYFLKIMASNHYLDIETNKNKSARLDLNKLNFKSYKSNFLIDFLKLDNDEYLENCFRLENFLD